MMYEYMVNKIIPSDQMKLHHEKEEEKKNMIVFSFFSFLFLFSLFFFANLMTMDLIFFLLKRKEKILPFCFCGTVNFVSY